MFSVNVSLQHIFATDYNVRHPDLTDLVNPGDEPPSFVIASSILGGTIAAVIWSIVLLYLMFPPDKVKSLDSTEMETEFGGERERERESLRLLIKSPMSAHFKKTL